MFTAVVQAGDKFLHYLLRNGHTLAGELLDNKHIIYEPSVRFFAIAQQAEFWGLNVLETLGLPRVKCEVQSYEGKAIKGPFLERL